ncbi:MAG: hypothetical protein LBR57_00540 [Alistipes sp.]|jgi:hypothetical protein|nr:hypothetical protein [Alistipes sp.]
MKKLIFIGIAFLTAMSAAAQNQGGEQLSKQLEVTRAYTPRVGQANKLDITPDMTDTVRLRPEITYNINSVASATTFSVRPFSAAKMNASPFEMRQPFYLRAGIGLPLQSVVDLYYAPRMRNNRTFGIYANHRGQWSELTNDADIRTAAADKYFEAGIFGAKHLDSLENYIISGELAYDYRGYQPYGVQDGVNEGITSLAQAEGLVALPSLANPVFRGGKFFRDRVRGSIAIGDNFLDLAKFNYRVGLGGAFSRIDGRESQSDIDFNFRAAQMFGARKNQGFDATLRVRGAMDLDDHNGYWMPDGKRYGNGGVRPADMTQPIRENNWIPEGGAVAVTFEPRYVITGKVANMRLGFVARYVNNRAWRQNYISIAPVVEANANLLGGVFVPFASYTSHMVDGSVEATSRINPYIYKGYSSPTGWINDARAGFSGDLGDVFSYRIAGGMSLFSDYRIFTAVQEVIVRDPAGVALGEGGGVGEAAAGAAGVSNVEYLPVWFEPRSADGARFTLGAEFGVRGIGGFSGRLYINWNSFEFSGVWTDSPPPVGDLSKWDGGLEVAYNHRKLLNVRLDAHLVGARQYNLKYIINDYRSASIATQPEGTTLVTATDINSIGQIRSAVDISLAADYQVLNNFWVFVEGHNLAGMKLYPYPTYRGHGASVMAGIKLAF